MQLYRFESLAPELRAGLMRSVSSFLDLRVYLVGRFGVRDAAIAEAAIRLYRRTLDPNIFQIHVLVAAEGQKHAKSFVIPPDANSMLVDAGFYRLRYRSVEEADGQYKNPAPPCILYVWMDGNEPRAMFLATSTEINGKPDSKSLFILRRGDHGEWLLFRAYQLECGLHSNAWQLGNAVLTKEVLPGVAKLCPTEDELMHLIRVHSALTDMSPNTQDHWSCYFQYGHSSLTTGDAFLEWVERKDESALAELYMFVGACDMHLCQTT